MLFFSLNPLRLNNNKQNFTKYFITFQDRRRLYNKLIEVGYTTNLLLETILEVILFKFLTLKVRRETLTD